MNKISSQLIQTYARPSLFKSIYEITLTLGLLLLAYAVFYIYASHHPLLIFLLSFPAGLLLVRVFIIQHDAGHGTFFRNNKWNHVVGLICSLFTLTPYFFWRQAHAIHHKNSSDIDKRGIGDIDFKTVKEYKALNKWQKIKYIIIRHPLFLIGLGGFIYFLIQNRYFNYNLHYRSLFRKTSLRSIYITNIVCLLLYLSIFYYAGYLFFLVVLLPIFWASSTIGIYLFYVQHNFENVYFGPQNELTRETVIQNGSSFLNLPSLLRWVTGNIGYHHMHHLCPKIPFYNLKESHEKLYNPVYVPKILTEYSLLSSWHLLKLKLYDEENKRMISWSEYAKLISS